MTKKTGLNIHDLILAGMGLLGAFLLVYGLIIQKNNDSVIYGIKTNDTVVVACGLMILAILYKTIAKILKNKFGK